MSTFDTTHKDTFSLDDLLSFVPASQREAVIERAAIMEYEANQAREQAETNALLDWKRQRGQK